MVYTSTKKNNFADSGFCTFSNGTLININIRNVYRTWAFQKTLFYTSTEPFPWFILWKFSKETKFATVFISKIEREREREFSAIKFFFAHLQNHFPDLYFAKSSNENYFSTVFINRTKREKSSIYTFTKKRKSFTLQNHKGKPFPYFMFYAWSNESYCHNCPHK